MANLTQVPGSVKAGPHATKKDGICGVTIVAGNVLFLDSTTKKLGLADANGSGDALVVEGIALDGGSLDQPIKYVSKDDALNLGATLIPGTTYVLSDTPGAICPDADMIAADTVTVLGNASSASLLDFNPTVGGVKP